MSSGYHCPAYPVGQRFLGLVHVCDVLSRGAKRSAVPRRCRREHNKARSVQCMRMTREITIRGSLPILRGGRVTYRVHIISSRNSKEVSLKTHRIKCLLRLLKFTHPFFVYESIPNHTFYPFQLFYELCDLAQYTTMRLILVSIPPCVPEKIIKF